MKFKVLFALFFFLISAIPDLLASPEDTAKKEIKIPTVIKYIHGNALSSGELHWHSLDTTLDDLEIFNPAIRLNYNYLSTTGSAASSQIFFPGEDIYTDAGFHTYDLYLFREERIRYFKTNKAFSELNYHLAGGKEQQLTIALSENILKNWNIGLDFNRLGSQGFLKNGTTFHSNFDIYTWLSSKNSRYNLLAFAYWNTIENNVNGGLHSDSLFDNTSVTNLGLQGLLVNLDDGEHHFRNHKFSLSQFYDLGYTTEEKKSDTVITKHFKPLSRVGHSITLEERSFTYLDGNPGNYYSNNYFSTSSLDSIHYYDLRNRFSFSSLADSLQVFYYSFALEHQWMRYAQVSNESFQFLDTIFENTSVTGTLGTPKKINSISFDITGAYVFAGANKADYKGEALLHTPLSKFGYIDLSAKVLLKSPEFIHQRYYSNHFIWENNFEKSMEKNVSAQYSYPEWNVAVGAELTSVSRYIYLDSIALPVQSQSEIRVLKYFLDKNFRFGKFHLNNSFIFQKTDHSETLHLPELISTQSLFYESWFYKNALLLRIGFDFHFNSSYYAEAFMPATGLFYWQDEKKTGGYSLLDFVISFRIKSARMFVKFENIGDDIFGKGYYLTPHYPMQGMTLQFGVKWRFFDQ